MSVQIRDPIHGFLEFSGKEVDLINTRLLQRLRGVRQLAMASLVYPGAVHTRFDHTLGVVHIAGKMADALGLDDVSLLRFSAILHDIGHGPFSHVSENILERYAVRSKISGAQKTEKIHELVTALLINTDREMAEILAKRDREKIVDILNGAGSEPVITSIVSGPLDADKQDYLLRDSYFCGVEYGVFDLAQLHRSFTAQGDDNGRYLMLKDDGIHAAEQYMLAKYYLTTNVYRHKVRLITDQMIIRAIVLGIDVDKIKKLKALYSFDNSADFVDNYKEWDDASFMAEFGPLGDYRDTKCREILTRLTERQLFKRVFRGKQADFSDRARDKLNKLGQADYLDKRCEIERIIAEELGSLFGAEVDANYVILHVFNIKSVREMSRNDDSEILISKRPEPVPFEQESILFKSINEGMREEFVEVYAPVSWSNRTHRNQMIDRAREPVVEAINKILGSDEREAQ